MATSDPFEYTATGVLGDKRETMLENQLLLRNELGRPMRRGYTSYPGNVWTYGKPNPRSNGGAMEALHWSGVAGLHFPGHSDHRLGDVSKSANALPGRDFVALNRAAIKAGLTTSNEHYQFRATNDIRKKPQLESDAGGKSCGPSRRLPPSMVFGISTRPSTPIHDLIEHRFQDRWLAERRSADMAQRQGMQTQESSPASLRLGKVNETRASQLRVHQVPVEDAPLWKLPKFSKRARPHLSTFRSPASHDAAYTHANTDSIGRQGMQGLGTYVEALS